MMATRPLTPLDVAGCKLWFDFSDLSTLRDPSGNPQTAGAVLNGATITDKAQGIVATLVISSGTVTYVTSAQGLGGAVYVNGNSHWNFDPSTLPAGSAARSFLTSAYCTNNSGADGTIFSYGGQGNGRWIKIWAQVISQPYGPSVDTYNATNPISAIYGWYGYDRATVYAFSGGASNQTTVYWEGDQDIQSAAQGLTTSPSNGSTTMTGYIGWDLRGYIASFSGYYRHIVCHDHFYTATERAQMQGWESWATGKSGSNLPSSHPYKSAAPTISTGGVIIMRRRPLLLIAA